MTLELQESAYFPYLEKPEQIIQNQFASTEESMDRWTIIQWPLGSKRLSELCNFFLRQSQPGKLGGRNSIIFLH